MVVIIHDVHVLAHPMSLDEFFALELDLVELVDGVPIVNPSPSFAHQSASIELASALHLGMPDTDRVITAPMTWVVSAGTRPTVRQPDLLVAPLSSFGPNGPIAAPSLVIEILSPSSYERDLVTKRREYAAAGAQHYWIVDPPHREIVLLELRDGAYVEAHRMSGAPLDVTQPFPVRLDPDVIFRDIDPSASEDPTD